MSKREIVFDTETTGLDPFSGHRIVELGCVEMIDKSRTGKTFHAYLNPERDVPEEAFRVHGIATDFLKDKPLFAHVVEEFIAFVGDGQLVIHNAGFDMKFINWELENAGFAAIPMERATDTLMIARRKFPGAPNSLDALCKRFMIDLSSRTKHGALLDAELLAEVYVELTGGKQVAISFDRIEVKDEVEEEGDEAAILVLPERQFLPSAEELAAHEAFVARLKKPIWEEA